MNKLVTIVTAACKRGDEVWTGQRHNEIIAKMVEDGIITSVRQIEQGFMTSEDVFVDRYDAAKIAFVSGQISRIKDSLSSEDVW
jgi:hypothetical protein